MYVYDALRFGQRTRSWVWVTQQLLFRVSTIHMIGRSRRVTLTFQCSCVKKEPSTSFVVADILLLATQSCVPFTFSPNTPCTQINHYPWLAWELLEESRLLYWVLRGYMCVVRSCAQRVGSEGEGGGISPRLSGMSVKYAPSLRIFASMHAGAPTKNHLWIRPWRGGSLYTILMCFMLR